MATSFSNRGPVSSAFIPPETCLYLTQGTTTFQIGHHYYGGDGCYPPPATGIIDYSDFDNGDWGSYYYSPMFACPTGWQTAASLTMNPETWSTSRGVSAYLCCPGNLTPEPSPTDDTYHRCSSLVTPGQVLTNVIVTLEQETEVLTTTTISTQTEVNADGIVMLWAPSDKAAQQTTSTTSLTQTTTSSTSLSPTATNTSPASSTSTNPTPRKRRGISAGAVIGIVIAAILLALGLIGVLFLYLRRQKKQLGIRTPMEPKIELEGSNRPAELHGKGSGLPRLPEFSTPANINELPTSPDKSRGNSWVQELPADQVGHRKSLIPNIAVAQDSILESGDAIKEGHLSSIRRKSVPPVAPSSPPTDEIETVASGSGVVNSVAEEEKLRVLQERMERIREDKARLQKIQELMDLEEQTKAEILAAQKKAMTSEERERE